jgi:hypothetical protein
MGLRSRQKNQAGATHQDSRLTVLDELDGAVFDQVQMPALCVALKVMQTANVPGVEDARTQGKLG